jgi:hypothetical protein
MGLMNMGYGNVGLTGGDLPYYIAGMAGKAAGAASGLGWNPLAGG